MNRSDQPWSADDVAGSIRELMNEIRRLWQAVDELHEKVFREFPHRREEPPDSQTAPAATPPLRLTSMPLDPCDPNFGRKINAVETPAAPPACPRAATLNEFVARLTHEAPATQMSFDEWTDGQAMDSGVVIEVDDDLFDWFADHFEAEYEAPGGVYVLSGDNGGQYVIWSNETDIFLRRLTEVEESEFAELTRIAADKAELKREQFRDSQLPQKQQGSLW